MLQLAMESDREAVNRLAKQVHSLHVSWRPDIYEMAGELYSEERFRKAVAQRQQAVHLIARLQAPHLAGAVANGGHQEPQLIVGDINIMDRNGTTKEG